MVAGKSRKPVLPHDCRHIPDIGVTDIPDNANVPPEVDDIYKITFPL
jgi:hypothetical protein